MSGKGKSLKTPIWQYNIEFWQNNNIIKNGGFKNGINPI
jgi:hypothetical protein